MNISITVVTLCIIGLITLWYRIPAHRQLVRVAYRLVRRDISVIRNFRTTAEGNQ